jgi:hypothetical protein
LSLESFVLAVKSVPADRRAMRRFYDTELAWLRENHPEITDPDKVLRTNIGWCFGENIPLAIRKLWAAETGAEHLVAGPEFAQRDFTSEELLRAGMNYAERMIHEQTYRTYPTAWDVVLQDRFG